ncbi:MAG: GIY-YIG nuclease family protein [Terriglobia bacterium]
MSDSKGWSCYALECADGSYYVGVATDLDDRLQEHNAGWGARHTRLRKPVRLVWFERCASYPQVRALEARLKGWSREKKSRLVAGSLRLDPGLTQGE